MQVLYPRCCGMDVHKKMLVACVMLTSPDGSVQKHIQTFSTTTAALLACLDWLESLQVDIVGMESTGVYWKPVYNLLEGHMQVFLVNAQHMRTIPGQKTDIKDSEWIADLLRHNLLKASFIPPQPIRELRDLTRYRKTIVQEHTQEVNRLQKVLETANLKLASVASDVLGRSGRDMLDALVAGQRDPDALADLARGRLRGKVPELRQALDGRLQAHQVFLLQQILAHIDFLDQSIAQIEGEIQQRLGPFQVEVSLLESLPVILNVGAAVVIAEIGTDMSRFPSAKHLASWAGVCPGNKVSGGKRLSGKTTKGNRYLRSLLCQLAWAIARCKEPNYLTAQYHHIARRRGKKRAILAVAHSLLVIIYHLIRDKVPYHELGADFFAKRETGRIQRQAVARLEQLGYHVTLAREEVA
jgi:Transposase and inactivated derivatives